MSGFYIGVDGKARKIKGGYIGVDGVARKVKKGYIGVDGVARLCWADVDPVFANNTWEEIAAACQSGFVPDTWAVGDQKTMKIGTTDYVVDIIGKNHDDYADGSGKAPLTFQLHDCYSVKHPMNTTGTNVGGWEQSIMRITHLTNIFVNIQADIQAAIREVTKLTSGGGKSSTIVATADKLFLLSEVEVFGNVTHSVAGEGSQYPYYKNNALTKKWNGANNHWSLRSPVAKSNEYFCIVTQNGATTTGTATYNQGTSFAFCL